jgi:hypothetical protein
MDGIDGSWGAARWTRTEKIVLAAALACFLSALAYVNGFYVCYPQDNDLDEVGWITAHLTLGRPESLANQGYPPGLPVVLRLLSPLVGSLLRATFLWQALAATASVFFVTRITAELCRHKWAALLGALFAAIACLRIATSEFADGTSTAIFLGGLWALSRRGADQRGAFWFGLACGASYLFRTHYLMLLAFVPASLFLSGFGWRAALRLALPFAGGFAATAWPLWLLNLLAYGTPLHAGVSQYNIAHAVIPNAFSWVDYPHTYNQWPLSRILRERPMDLVHHALRVAKETFGNEVTLIGAVLGGVATALVRDRKQRQLVAFCLWLSCLYILLVIVPTHYTDRAYAPIAMLAAVLAACGVAELCDRVPGLPRWGLGAVAAGLVVFLAFPSDLRQDLQGRKNMRRWNEKVVRALEANGLHSSDEVFTNMWGFYPLQDPGFVTFYNYGGWIELDSEYARERPHPTATRVSEWQEFFRAHDIHFAVLQKRAETKAIFKHAPPDWKRIYSDRRVSVWALPSLSKGPSNLASGL